MKFFLWEQMEVLQGRNFLKEKKICCSPMYIDSVSQLPREKGIFLGERPKFPREQMVSKTLWAYNFVT